MFIPPFCPIFDCPTRTQGIAFTWRKRGYYWRKCDGRTVRRFSCNACNHRFSAQTFKTDFRWRKPKLHFRLFDLFISKVTIRQMARITRVRRPTIERRLRCLGQTCKDFHAQVLGQLKDRGGICGIYQMDELETYEQNRRLSPVTMPVLIERSSYFVIHGEAATMAARGGLSSVWEKKKKRLEKSRGVRQSGSSNSVRNSLLRLMEIHSPNVGVQLQTDRKASYRSIFRAIAKNQFRCHSTTSSKAKRDKENLLFPINHTFAMMRDSISRLVRRTWAASKSRLRLDSHFWIWVAYRNYIRGVTVTTKTTPAQALGVLERAWSSVDLLRWKWPQIGLTKGH